MPGESKDDRTRIFMKIARSLRTLLFVAIALAIPASSFAGIFIGISIGVAPPPLPVYAQPPIPGDGYMWTPGYWAWGPDGYYWVPGTWVQPPQVGVLWTPGYWGWNNGAYAFNAGYWGPHIGFYGGVNYGFGFGGVGYEGGYWNNGHFAYNTSVNNVSNVHITNVYNKTVINNTTVNNTSFNGGTNGIQARPTPAQEAAAHENHIPPTPVQVQHVTQAQNNPQLRASVNGGKPAIAATARPGDFKSAVPAKAAGGHVDTAVYKAAATNGGKLPPGMKDPGSVRPASATASRSVSNPDEHLPAANKAPDAEKTPATESHPANGAMTARPAAKTQPAAHPEAQPAHSQAEPKAQPKPQAEPKAQPKPQAEPKAEPKPQAEPKAQPKPQAEPKAQPKPKPQPKPQSKPAEHEEKPK
jgi:hypothetical protein